MMRLSPQQYECVSLVARGMENSEIADALGLERGTVKRHLEMALRKTGARNRVVLALMFERRQIAAPMLEAA